MKRTVKIAFTDFWHPNTERAIRNDNPIYRLLSKRFDLQLSDHPDFLLYSCFGRKYLKYRCTRIFYTGENIRPDFRQCDFAFSFDYPITAKNYRLPLYKLYEHFDEVKKKGQQLPDPGSQRFCNFVVSNRKAKERIEFFRLLQKYKKVDSAGSVLNNMGGRIGDKMDFLRRYKFTIAFENSSYPGYTTEKILDALIANTVPIYWGNPLVNRDFNPGCFINCHDFESFEEVVERVKEIDLDDDLYLAHLAAPVFRPDSEYPNIRDSNILAQFENIFSGKTSSEVAGKLDPLKYYVHPRHVPDALRRLVWWARR